MPRDRDDDRDDRDDDRPRRRRDDDDDDDDRPRRSRRRSRRDDDDDFDRPAETPGNGMAIASLVLGLMSLVFGPITGLIGGILGLISLRKPTGRGLAVTGIVLSVVFTIGWVALGVYGYFRVVEASGRMYSSNNLKQMGLATHSHSDVYGEFPGPVARRPDERFGAPPSDLDNRLGWRVTILPFMEQNGLYQQFRLNEPWNSPANGPLANTPVRPYTDADARTDPTTRYRCFYDNGAIFDTRTAVRMTSVTDGLANTILYVEGGEKVTWTRFQEYKFDPKGPLPPLGRADKDGFNVGLADGSTRWVSKSVDPAILKAMITRAGGEVVALPK